MVESDEERPSQYAQNNEMKRKEFSLDLRGLRSEVARRVTEQINVGRAHAYQITVYPSQVSRVLSGERGSRWSDLIHETARIVAREIGGKS